MHKDIMKGGGSTLEREFWQAMIKEIFSWVKFFTITVAFALFFNFFVIVNAVIPSGSMEQTIMTGDRIIAFRLSYLLSEPNRHDIIILPDPDNPDGDLFIKRIVGMPGEMLLIDNGRVYVMPEGGTELEFLYEPFLNPNDPPRGTFGPVVVPANSFFLMGDNRNSSMDSRHWTNTFVHEDKIMGKAIFRYLPNFRILE